MQVLQRLTATSSGAAPAGGDRLETLYVPHRPPAVRPAAVAAAVLFAAAGVLALLAPALPGAVPRASTTLNALAVADLVTAGVLVVLPWHRLGRRGLVAVAVLALALAAAYGLADLVPAYGYPLFFMVVYGWVGLALPPRWPLALAPVLAVAYVLPLVDHGAAAVGTAVIAVPMLVLLAELVATSFARLEREGGRLAVAALLDELTGLGNRRMANTMLDTLRPGDAVLMVDVDRFKEVNDTHGHAVGDRLLSELGEFLTRHVRRDDVVTRMGGEEFLVILRGAHEHAGRLASGLVRAWRATAPMATVSIGVTVHEGGEPAQRTVERADARVYRAKRAGRNCAWGEERLAEA
ncbi:MAG TPA: GGDEF domain-containing protein [Solirubrobacteraceae bacterium]